MLAEEVVLDEAGLEDATLRRVPDDLVEEAEVVGVAVEGVVPRDGEVRKVPGGGAADDGDSGFGPPRRQAFCRRG